MTSAESFVFHLDRLGISIPKSRIRAGALSSRDVVSAAIPPSLPSADV